MKFEAFDAAKLDPGSKGKKWLDLEPGLDGIECRLPLLFAKGTSGPTLVVLSGVHGDEYEGPEAIPGVFADVDTTTLRGTLVSIPVCNVPAYEAIKRSSPIDGLNLARVFPGNRKGTITERIAYWLNDRTIRSADFLIDLHSGGVMYDIPTLVGYPDLGDDVGKRSRDAARAFGAPILWSHPSVAPGRTISAATDFGIPSIYTEAAGGGFARASDVACFRSGVLNIMKWLDMLDGESEGDAPKHDLHGEGNMDEVLSAGVRGYFRPDVRLLEHVGHGQRLGLIRDFHGDIVEELTADRGGIVIMLRRLHYVEPGDGLAHITQERTR